MSSHPSATARTPRACPTRPGPPPCAPPPTPGSGALRKETAEHRATDLDEHRWQHTRWQHTLASHLARVLAAGEHPTLARVITGADTPATTLTTGLDQVLDGLTSTSTSD